MAPNPPESNWKPTANPSAPRGPYWPKGQARNLTTSAQANCQQDQDQDQDQAETEAEAEADNDENENNGECLLRLKIQLLKFIHLLFQFVTPFLLLLLLLFLLLRLLLLRPLDRLRLLRQLLSTFYNTTI